MEKPRVTETSHVALIKLRALHTLSDDLVEGLARTISQLNKLGLACVVVVDIRDDAQSVLKDQSISRRAVVTEADRLVSAFEKRHSTKASRLDDLLGISEARQCASPTVQVRGAVEVQFPDLLIRTLQRGVIPVVPAIAFYEDTQRVTEVSANEVMLAITRIFAGIQRPPAVTSPRIVTSSAIASSSDDAAADYILDKIVLIDPSGAIPSGKRPDETNIFLNLEQEYSGERRELLKRTNAGNTGTAESPQHLQNLDLLRDTLALLPPSASALLTTPERAATPSRLDHETASLGVQTRRPKNPLIFNLLTDKPLISSSLPAARMNTPRDGSAATVSAPGYGATFAKRGMPVTMIPDPWVEPWVAPRSTEKHMSLEDPRIDFPRLLTLIEDSFNRPLDVAHYLDRIKNRIAGIIVAGEYEGGAILTWELPPGVADDGSEETRQRMVPYLDKFAVLKRSQGAGGVADIVFSAMVRTCFPDGVCWRSRRDNPVNKWYFERSVGTFKIPDSNWTMFWTNPDLQQDSQRWRDYEAVCRTVMPSWADNKALQD